MDTKKNIYKIWRGFHLFFVVGICCFSAYDKYHKFYHLKRIEWVDWLSVHLLFHKYELLYGHLTGTGAGYGFFAPNVKSNGLIVGHCDDTVIMPEFRSFESTVRFNSLSSRITDYLIDDGDSLSKEQKKMQARYYDLVFKNIAVKTYHQNRCIGDSFSVGYHILSFPTLERFRAKRGLGQYTLREVKEVKLTKLKIGL